MKPNTKFILIDDNLSQIERFIAEAVIEPKHIMKRWSLVTGQTPAVKIGYVGQHLASLITGVPGSGSGARGDDLIDGTEVKSCNKVDQVDKCKSCGAHVMRYEEKCPSCESTRIDRKDDSKWLFSIRDEHELRQYENLDRILLILMDYPNFDAGDYRDIRISSYEIYPKEDRMKVFVELIRNHFYNIYMPKVTGQLREGMTKGNPMNLHPFGYQFYKCNPILTFSCTIKNIDTKPEILIDEDKYVTPTQDRNVELQSLLMPTDLLNDKEWDILLENADFQSEIRPFLRADIPLDWLKSIPKRDKVQNLPLIDERLRWYLPLRDIKPVLQREHYQR